MDKCIFCKKEGKDMEEYTIFEAGYEYRTFVCPTCVQNDLV